MTPSRRSANTVGRITNLALLTSGITLSVGALLLADSFDIFMTMTFGAALCLLLFVLYLPAALGLGIVKSYFAVLVLFHFGLLPAYLLKDKGVPLSRVHHWITDDFYVRPALEACLAFALTFAIAIVAAHLIGAQSEKAAEKPQRTEVVQSPWIYRLALGGLAISTTVWFVFVFGMARPSNYVDYIVFFEMNPALGNLIGVLHTAIAATFFLTCQNARKLWAPLLIFGWWAIFAFPLGLRGEVLFPIALTLPALMAQGRLRIHWSLVITAALGVLIVSAVVANSRLGDGSGALVSASPLTAISELGGSLRPSYEVERWLHQGDALRLGATYYAPFERTFLGLLPFSERLPAQEDYRLMNVLIMQRAGPYGFSIVAESVINFGFLGAIAMGGLWGLIVTFSTMKVASNHRTMVYASLLFGAFIHIRQSFVSAFGATIIFFVLSMSVILMAMFLKSSRR